MAAAIENSPWINDQARRMNLTSDDALGLNLYTAFREDHAIEAPRNDDAIPFNLSLNFGVFPEHDGLLRNNISLHVSVDPKCSGKSERAFKRHTSIDETGPLFPDSVL